MAKWQISGAGNSILEGEDFYISYNPCPGMGLRMFMGDGGSDETALVIEGEDKKFLILNGDYREEYEKLFPFGLEKCIEFYEKHKKESQSSWATDYRSSKNCQRRE